MSTISASTTSTTAYKVTADTTGTLVLQTGATPTTAVTIDGSQNVGIGTSSPVLKTEVRGAGGSPATSGTTPTGITAVSNGDTYGTLYTGAYATSPYALWMQGASRAALGTYHDIALQPNGGSVGVGMSSPSTWGKLVVADSSGSSANADMIVVQTGYSPSSYRKTGLGWTDGSNITGRIATTYNGTTIDMTFGSLYNSGYNSNELMRLTGSGNLLVGTTSLGGAGGVTFQVAASGGATQQVFNRTDAGATNSAPMIFRNGGTQVGYIQYNNTLTTYGTGSDYRLKENIVPMTGALEKVSLLKPCTYTWKVDGSDGQGFIAHELQEVVPNCVTGEKDAIDTDGNPVYQGIDTSFLVATLTAAIQELKAELDAAKADIETLKGAA